MASDGAADVTCCGRLFQIRGAATGKARSLTVDSHVRRTISDDAEAERRRHRASVSAGWQSSSARCVCRSVQKVQGGGYKPGCCGSRFVRDDCRSRAKCTRCTESSTQLPFPLELSCFTDVQSAVNRPETQCKISQMSII